MRSWPAPALPIVPGSPPPLQLHDTATDGLLPAAAGTERATMYVCGVTPYDTTHLGHAATYLTFDLVYRQLADAGLDVHYVQNITDVDDPLFERAARDGVSWEDLGDREIELFRADMDFLDVLPPHDYVGVIEAMDSIIELVGEIVERGDAYVIDGDHPDIYFPITATADFGYESRYDRETMAELFAERGGDPDRPGKRDPLDALLWRAARDGEPAWDAPFGRGRPGWHVECSAIARRHLGMGFDVQGGGSDLRFPHHEYSAAHAESACGGGDGHFARMYVHAAMIGLDGVKMSKSLGNLVRVRNLRDQGVEQSAIRLALFAGHYREDRSWSDELLERATERLARWRTAASAAGGADGGRAVMQVRAALADDLDTPAALAALDEWAAATTGGDHSDPDAPATIRSAGEALLGVRI